MLILVITAAVVLGVVLTVAVGMYLWRVVRGDRARVASPHKSVDKEFRKIARRIGRLDPGDDE